jgi:hypothetical protein
MIYYQAGNAAHPEKRGATRYCCRAEVSCRVLDPQGECAWSAWVANVSATGICLLLKTRLEPGHIVTLHVYTDDSESPRRLLAEVRHAEIFCPNNAWLHGLSFLRHLRNGELQGLIPFPSQRTER